MEGGVHLTAFKKRGMFSTGTSEGNRKAMNRNWSNQKANPALKTKSGNK